MISQCSLDLCLFCVCSVNSDWNPRGCTMSVVHPEVFSLEYSPGPPWALCSADEEI